MFTLFEFMLDKVNTSDSNLYSVPYIKEIMLMIVLNYRKHYA